MGQRNRKAARLISSLLLALAILFSLTGCNSSTATPPQSTEGSSEFDGFDLASLTNPFIGKWQSEIPSANAKVSFDYRPDGTFSYEMEGIPEDQGGKGDGGYVVAGNILVTLLEFEGAEAYTFEVVNNNTINVTELTITGNGEKVKGQTVAFTRIGNSEINNKSIPFSLSNSFIGKWQSNIPSAGLVILDYKADGTFDFEMPGIPEDQGGKGTGCYIVFGDKQATFLDFEGASAYSYIVKDADTITVTELEPNADGVLTAGDSTDFTRVK